MEIAVESIASSLNLAATKDHGKKHTEIRTKPIRLPKMDSPDKSQELCKRIFLTVAMFLTYHGMGLNSGIVGPTLVHLEYLFNTDTAGIAQVIMWMNLGYLCGSILCVLVFDRINNEMQFAFWGLMVAVTTTLLPWMPNLYTYFALTALQFVSHGVMYSGGQSFTLKLWAGNSFQRPIMQATHMMWSLGGFIAPFISMPFLVELDHSNGTRFDNGTDVNGSSLDASTESLIVVDEPLFASNSFYLEGVYKIRYIYGIVGTVDMIAAILFVVGYFLMGPKCTPHTYNLINISLDENSEHMQEQEKISPDDVTNNNTKTIKILKGSILCVVIVIVVMFFWHETVIGSYMAAFTIKGLNWTPDHGALVSSIFFGCHGLGRVAGVFISKFLTPTKVILINMIMAIVGLSLLLFSYAGSAIIYTGTAVVGFFIATTFPSLILWLSDYITISGVMGGMFMAAASVGSMSVAPLVGYLFQNYTHMWVVYISLGSGVLTLVIFLGLLVLGRVLSNYQDVDKTNNVNKEHEPALESKA